LPPIALGCIYPFKLAKPSLGFFGSHGDAEEYNGDHSTKGEKLVSYPVTFEADYHERQSRLTTFFRIILIIPVAIVLYVFGIVASVAILIAWFAIVITGRYPKGLYTFVADFNRFVARVTAYGVLLTDTYPPFSGADDPAYPVRMGFAGPLESYSRLKTFFRLLLAIPIMIMRYVMGLLLEIGAFAAWFAILVTGKMPRGLFDLMVLANSYTARSDAYLYLLTETYPPFQDETTRTAGTAGPTIPETPSPS
jgi:Domain of unknown function (DUF4389)